MADDQVEGGDASGENDGEDAPKGLIGRLFSGKTKFISMGVLALMLLGGAGAGAAFYLGWFAPPSEDDALQAALEEIEPAFFYDLPELTVNLSSTE